MRLRLAILASSLAWATAAWAQTAEATAAASKAADSIISTGPIGAVFVVYCLASAVVIAALWKRSRDLEKDLKDCQDKRLSDTASFIEKIAKSGSDASAAISGNNAVVGDLVRIANAILALVQTVPPLVASVKDETGLNRNRVELLSDLIRDRLPGAGK